MTEDSPVDRRLPGAQAEFEALHEKIWARLQPRQDGKHTDNDAYVRISLDIPQEWMWLAAWLTIKDNMRRQGDLGPLSDITHHDRLVRHHAKMHFARLIDFDMHMQLTELANGQHPVLYAPEPKKAPALMDDDIPF